MTKIFTDTNNINEQTKVIMNYYNITKEDKYKLDSNSPETTITSLYKELQDSRNNNSKRNLVYQYYEYVQFKRAKFDCTNVEYDSQSGRIIKMDFKFTGKFQ